MTNNDDAPGTDDRTRTMPHSDNAIPCCMHCPQRCEGDHIVWCMCQLWSRRRKDSE